MSRSEREYPELVADVLRILDSILDGVIFRGNFKNERHIMKALARHLKKKTDFEIEVEPTTPFGKPDILIEAVVALELKKGLSQKAEIDRCVGQSAGFSRQWFTIVLVFDAPISRVQMLENLLEDKNLDHIPVIYFSDLPE